VASVANLKPARTLPLERAAAQSACIVPFALSLLQE
jgi:hypothetical protein